MLCLQSVVSMISWQICFCLRWKINVFIDLRRNILDRNFKDNLIHIENIYETNSNVIVVINKEHTQHAINYL